MSKIYRNLGEEKKSWYYNNGVKCGVVFSDKLEIYFSYIYVGNKISNLWGTKKIIYCGINIYITLPFSKIEGLL